MDQSKWEGWSYIKYMWSISFMWYCCILMLCYRTLRSYTALLFFAYVHDVRSYMQVDDIMRKSSSCEYDLGCTNKIEKSNLVYFEFFYFVNVIGYIGILGLIVIFNYWNILWFFVCRLGNWSNHLNFLYAYFSCLFFAFLLYATILWISFWLRSRLNLILLLQGIGSCMK